MSRVLGVVLLVTGMCPLIANLDASPTLSRSENQCAIKGHKQPPDQHLEEAVECALTISAAEGAAIAMLEERGMLCRASAGEIAPPVGSRVDIQSGISGACVRARVPIYSDNTELDARVDRDSCQALGISSVVAVPILIRGNRVVGLIEIFSRRPYAFACAQRVAVQRIASSIALSLDFDSPHSDEDPIAFAKSNLTNRLPLGSALAVLLGAAIWLAVGHNVTLSNLGSRAAEPSEFSGASTAGQLLDNSITIAELRRSAKKGDAIAAFRLGAKYAHGDEIAQNYSEAIKWFTLAAKGGQAPAAAALGAFYWAGRGVKQDDVQAYMWSAIAKACGDEASKYRVDILSSHLSAWDRAEAEQRAAAWLRAHSNKTLTESRSDTLKSGEAEN